MKDAIEKFEVEGLTVKIYQELEPQSPDEWADEGLFLVGVGSREFYVRPPGVKDRHWDMESLVEKYGKTHRIYPIEAYIHSGVTLYLRGACKIDRMWDVSQVGAVFVSRKEWRYEKKALKVATSLIEEWNQYLSGDVYGYVIEDKDGKHLDSCWGFYGMEYALEEAKDAAGHHAKEIRKKHQARLKAMILNKVPLAKRAEVK